MFWVDNLIHASTKTTCSKKEILEALEGVFLLGYRLYVDDSTELHSGWSYGEFRWRYVKKLWQDGENRSDHVHDSIHCNTLYYQVWTFALTINTSLPTITLQNLSVRDYWIRNTKVITEILKAFVQGASGWVFFNEQQEVPSFVDVFQFRNGALVQSGV